MRDFRRLKVWEKAHGLSLAIYKATATFPKQELFAFTSQLRHAAGSSRLRKNSVDAKNMVRIFRMALKPE